MKSSLSKGISLRNSKRKRKSLGKRVYREFEDKKDYFTKYNIKYEVIEKKKVKKKPKIRSIKLSSVDKNENIKEKKSKVEKEIDLLALEGEIFKKEKQAEKEIQINPNEEIQINPNEEIQKKSKEEEIQTKDTTESDQDESFDPSIKKIFVTNIDAEGDKNPLVL